MKTTPFSPQSGKRLSGGRGISKKNRFVLMHLVITRKQHCPSVPGQPRALAVCVTNKIAYQAGSADQMYHNTARSNRSL